MRTRMVFMVVAALLALAQVVAAQEPFPIVVKAYEVEPGSMRLPGSVNGTLSFQPCNGCDYKTVRVSANTRYEANGEVLRLEEFREAVVSLGSRGRTSVTVKHHLESDLITSIRVSTY